MENKNNNIFNNKYSKFLTVILIIVIIIVIALLALLGYDVYRKYTIEGESEDAVSKFEGQFNNEENTVENTQIENNQLQNDIDPLINAVTENVTSGSSGGSSSSSKNPVTYKGYEVVGTIEIPKTNIHYPIIKEDDMSVNSMKVAICNLYGELNAPGSNAVLVGHNYRNGTLFSNNKKLTNGDEIYITDNSGQKVKYIVYKKYETGSGDFSYAEREIGDKREISLSTCNDDSSKRIIIWAKEQ